MVGTKGKAWRATGHITGSDTYGVEEQKGMLFANSKYQITRCLLFHLGINFSQHLRE